LISSQSKSDWWKRAVIYEIAPISFQDTNGDGKGDLKEIERRIDYLQWLGVDAVWLTPFFISPMLDFGYDIVDFCSVDPMYGTLEDFDRLVDLLHRRGYKRSSETEAFTVALNLTHEARALGDVEEGKLVISTFLDRTGVPIRRQYLLRPDEGIIFRTR
jgi:Alpha amylase, catalytic domain